jgi:hypothetical protein
MARDYFHLVAQIIAEDKYFDVSLAEIERQLDYSGKFRFESESLLDNEGTEVTIPIRLYIGYTNGPEGWSVALVLHNVRVDCIDWEAKYRGIDGNNQSGWHRHQWDHASKTCSDRKIPIPDLNVEISLHEFLVRCFNLMAILLNRDDHGNHELRFN